MKEVKAATYDAAKARRIARGAVRISEREELRYLEAVPQIFARIDGIGRDWEKKGKPGMSSHEVRVWKAEKELDEKHIRFLEAKVVAMSCENDARDAEFNAQCAVIERLKRLLRAARAK